MKSQVLALLLLAVQVQGYAELWAVSNRQCTAHPTTAQNRHAAPVQDSATSISISDASGAVTTLCPGATYTLQVSFPSARGALVTVSAGTLSDNSNAFGCTNRFARSELISNRRPAFSSGLTLPCIGSIAGGQLQVRVTSAIGELTGFLQASATYSVDAACGVNAPSPPAPPPPDLSALAKTLTLVLAGATFQEVAADASSLTTFSRQLVDAVARALKVQRTQIEVLSVSPAPARRRALSRALAQAAAPSGVSVILGVTPSSADAAPALATAITAFVSNPLTSLSSVASLYGVTAAEVTLLGAPAAPDAPPAPTPPAGVACPPSALGYTCSSPTLDSNVRVHYSISGAMPENACTGVVPAGVPTEGMLHMAISALGVNGLVGLGFASSPGRMLNSDVVMGWVAPDGTAMVNSWSVPGNDYYYIQPTNAVAWATFRGVSATTDAAGVTTTTVCFSRPIVAAPSASVLATLDLNNTVDLIYAVSDGQYNYVQQHASADKLAINLATFSDIQVSGGVDKAYWLNVHAICMAVAWAGLLPLGALIPRHRWLSCAKFMVGGKQIWFWLHIITQLSGMALFIAGFVISWQYLPGGGLPVTGGSVGEAHQVLGIIVMALAGLQVVVGFVRPAPDSLKLRPAWNFLHHNLGRLSILVAWATIYLGIYIAHGSQTYAYSYNVWIVAMAVVMGTLVLTDVVLTVLRERAAARDAAMVAAQAAGDKEAGSAGKSTGREP
ncbi:hypothetical protein FOA52_002617 [Chlamydomonas sp. UWO 241]|nr:hypothetical protein FOA52_002617 [Chlamydomonas sp. UWO 241]